MWSRKGREALEAPRGCKELRMFISSCSEHAEESLNDAAGQSREEQLGATRETVISCLKPLMDEVMPSVKSSSEEQH